MVEASQDRLRRLLTLVPWLATHSGVSKRDAAAHFALTVPQLEADLALLTVTGPGLYGGDLVDIAFEDETITVLDAQGLVEPLRLTADEVAPLLLGLRTLAQLPDVDAALVARLIDLLGGEPEEQVIVEVPASPHTAVIARAIADGHDLRIEYHHPVRDDVAERHVHPMEVVTRDGYEYLQAMCHTAQAVRTFRLDRMRTCEPMPRAHADVTDEPPRREEPMRHAARVAVRAGAEHLLEGVGAHWIGAGVAEVPYADPAWVEAWLVAAGGGIRCIEPAELAEAVRARADAALAAYADVRDTL